MSSAITERYWNECLDQMRGYGSFIEGTGVTDSSETAVEAADYLLMTLAHAYILVTRGDPNYPEFCPSINHVFPYGGANPDATYYQATICGKGRYRIFGFRNTVNWVSIMPGYAFWGFSDQPGKSFPPVDLDDFQINPDGSFEILLCNERPEGHDGNWMKLELETDYLLIRQFANQVDEVDARMGIERLDPDGPPKLRDSQETEQKIREVIRHLRNSSTTWTTFPHRFKDVVNRLEATGYGSTGEVSYQMYHEGLYKIGLDEALVIEFKAPTSYRYWNIQLTDRWWRTVEYAKRRSTLNGCKDRSDGDGMTRLVVAHRDPGVENWVDVGGVIDGDMVMRWLHPSERPDLVTKLVAVDDIYRHLPADTKRVSPDQRIKELREWRNAKQLRRSW